MISSWFTSWYQHNEQKQQQQQQQLQEPFHDQYETTDDWVEVITPAMKSREQNVVSSPEPAAVPEAPLKKEEDTDDGPGKKLSRQERRAKARLAAREMKKQARTATMIINRNRGKGLAVSACLPVSPLATN